jgi:hypothetical protein
MSGGVALIVAVVCFVSDYVTLTQAQSGGHSDFDLAPGFVAIEVRFAQHSELVGLHAEPPIESVVGGP